MAQCANNLLIGIAVRAGVQEATRAVARGARGFACVADLAPLVSRAYIDNGRSPGGERE